MVESVPTDEELARLARTQPEAFGRLYQRYARMVHGVVLARTFDRDAAGDLTSLIFVKAWSAIGTFSGGSFRAWLLQIARNAVSDERRRWRHTIPLSDVVEMADPAPQPGEAVERDEEGARLRRAVEALPPGQQVVVRLRLSGLTDREIAGLTGKSNEAVRVLQHRAVQSLRARLADDR
jgi:RNA polymerase sigma-70 factor (ECF subfamily)